jgi:stage IV sporulation protein FB
VFFGTPQPTAFDLHWRMFGIDVRVHPLFWVMSAAMGWNISEPLGWPYIVVWVLCVFVSILIHEMGHVCMGWLFGTHGHIVLHAFGGLTYPDREASQRWQRILVNFGGCLFQFILAGIVLLVGLFMVQAIRLQVPEAGDQPLFMILFYLFIINTIWPLFNLLPIWPLDGGQIVREICEAIWRDRGRMISLSLSVGTAGVLALHLLLGALGIRLLPLPPFGGLYTAIFFALMAVNGFQLLQVELNQHRPRDDERLPWE